MEYLTMRTLRLQQMEKLQTCFEMSYTMFVLTFRKRYLQGNENCYWEPWVKVDESLRVSHQNEVVRRIFGTPIYSEKSLSLVRHHKILRRGFIAVPDQPFTTQLCLFGERAEVFAWSCSSLELPELANLETINIVATHDFNWEHILLRCLVPRVSGGWILLVRL